MTKLRFNHYYNYNELTNALKELADNNDQYAKLSSIGKSYEKRDVWCITITDYSSGNP